MNHLLVSIVEKPSLRLLRPVEIIVRIVLFLCMWMVRYLEIDQLPVDEQCIPLLMKSETDNSRYASNVNNVENIIETKEPMMTRQIN